MNEREQIVFKNGVIIPDTVEKKKKIIKTLSKKQEKRFLPLFMDMEAVTLQCKVICNHSGT